ncbi:hypothetical protein CIG19_10070 [Enterobacterales bacterium CwR94]|nr:hypothetical protein CIG19_10070 [Enterobacterales bacterium CwR94]
MNGMGAVLLLPPPAGEGWDGGQTAPRPTSTSFKKNQTAFVRQVGYRLSLPLTPSRKQEGKFTSFPNLSYEQNGVVSPLPPPAGEGWDGGQTAPRPTSTPFKKNQTAFVRQDGYRLPLPLTPSRERGGEIYPFPNLSCEQDGSGFAPSPNLSYEQDGCRLSFPLTPSREQEGEIYTFPNLSYQQDGSGFAPSPASGGRLGWGTDSAKANINTFHEKSDSFCPQ